jgi:hypothetical protein
MIHIIFILFLVTVMVAIMLGILYFLSIVIYSPPPPKPDYKKIAKLEHELGLGPPFHSELPQIERPTTVERVWR